MKKRILSCIVLSVALGTAALAASKKEAPKWKGTIAVTGKHSDAELIKMAKVSDADAQKTALAAVKGKSKKVAAHELEAENGFLVHSFDIKVTGKSGIEEIIVDAGSGKVLAHEHESAAAEKKEATKEKAEKGERGEKEEKEGK